MISSLGLTLIVVCFLLGLMVTGFFAALLRKKHPNIVDNGVIYSLSLGAYCTAASVYGSVQMAATSGMLFFAIGLGPVLGAIFWGPLLTKLIRLKNKYHLTSLADFISARFNKSIGLGALCTGICLVGFVPYIALQIRAILRTTEFLLQQDPNAPLVQPISNIDFEMTLVICIIIVTVFLGLRRFISTLPNLTMAATLALESLIKLVAILGGGVFIVYYLNDGLFAALDMLPAVVEKTYSYMGVITGSQLITWLSFFALSMFGVLLLPWQFYVAVVINTNEKHARTAKWLFPLFFISITLLVLPVAIYGIKEGLPLGSADLYMLQIPLLQNHTWVALGIYLGGLSAALGMIVTSCTTISTMATNQLIAPLFERFNLFQGVRRHLLYLRWLIAAWLIGLAYIYQRISGNNVALSVMGMISMVAGFQFVPVILAGLYWKSVSRRGAYLALSVGGLVWLYTLFLPAFVKGGLILDMDFLKFGPFGLSLLKAEALFGLEGLSAIGHGFIWTNIGNVAGLVIGSLIFPANEEESLNATEFLRESGDLMGEFSGGSKGKTAAELGTLIPLMPKLVGGEALLRQHFDESTTHKLHSKILADLGLVGRERVGIPVLGQYVSALEISLSGAIGAAAANLAIHMSGLISEKEKQSIFEYQIGLLKRAGLSHERLNQELDLHETKEKLIREYANSLESRLKIRTEELEASHRLLVQSSKMASLGEMAGGIAHEINTPLATICLCLDAIQRRILDNNLSPEKIEKSVLTMRKTVDRISVIVKGLKSFAREGGEISKIPIETKNISSLISEALVLCEEKLKLNSIELRIHGDSELLFDCRPIQLSQVILNLIGNSIDAISGLAEKWIEIEFVCHEDIFRLSVTDSGHGIPIDIAEKMMQPFFTTKEIGKGTGLGLSISNGLIVSEGGRLFLDSTCPNTRFIMEFPIRRSQTQAS
jgi:Na+/proline symporter/signal transduction histidine kinase